MVAAFVGVHGEEAAVLLRAFLASVLALGVLGAAPTVAQPAAPLRVMVVGDSISQGFGGDATWRYWFWREASRQGRAIDLVGPRRGFRVGYGTRYESPGLRFDADHAAWGGSTVNFHLGVIDGLMDDYSPDVVVVQLGVNDALRGVSGRTIAGEVQALVRKILSASFRTRVVLAEVPLHPTRADTAEAAADANGWLVALYRWNPRVTVARNVSDERVPWRAANFTFDGLHPNATGQTLIAQRFAEAFHGAGYLPDSPAIYRSRTWNPRVVPRVRQSRGVVTFDWSKAATEVRMASVRVSIRRAGSTTWRSTPWFRVKQHRATRRLAKGTYAVRLVPRRGTMVARPGPLSWSACAERQSKSIELKPRSFESWCSEVIVRIVPLRERMTSDWVTAPPPR
ncbi:lysophospholipase L1-like esterase [Nocardioides sp. J9]|nr:lysophospholipase L1-like esterase [Nocardioides sp. J9]